MRGEVTTLTLRQPMLPQIERLHLRAPYMGQPLANRGKTAILVLDAVHSGLISSQTKTERKEVNHYD